MKTNYFVTSLIIATITFFVFDKFTDKTSHSLEIDPSNIMWTNQEQKILLWAEYPVGISVSGFDEDR